MVIRYAVSEKNIIKEKQLKEASEKKLKEIIRENEILQHKVQTMVSEKNRICQMLDNKVLSSPLKYPNSNYTLF